MLLTKRRRAAHDVFGVPKNDAGNYLAGYGALPLFSAHVSVHLTFRPLLLSCSTVTDDRDAIATWGGGNSSYEDWDKQTEILSYYEDFAAESCPQP